MSTPVPTGRYVRRRAVGAMLGSLLALAGILPSYAQLRPAQSVPSRSQVSPQTVRATVSKRSTPAAAAAVASPGGCSTPTPILSYNEPVCVGTDLVLSAAGVPVDASYAWSGPNNFSSIDPSPVIQNATLADTGTYSLTINDNGCTASASISVSIIEVQSAAFSYAGGANEFCLPVGQTPTPTVTGTPGGVFAAPVLVIDAATGQVDLTAVTSGTYEVTYTTPGPCADTDTVFLTLTDPPSASFSYPAAQDTVCGNATNLLTPDFGTNGSAGTFSASSTDVALDQQSGEIFVGSSFDGTYTIYNTIAASGGCPASVDSAIITIEHLARYELTTPDGFAICQGDTITLNVEQEINEERSRPTPQALGALFYQFYFNGQPIAGATSSSYEASVAGDYFAIVSTSAGCADTTAAVTILVSPTQSAAFSYGPTTFCLGGAGVITPTVTGEPGGFFQDLDGLGVDGQTGAVDLSNAAAGTYQIAYITPGPCPGTEIVTLTLTDAPTAAFSYPVTAPVCEGTTGTLTPALATGAQAGSFSASPTGLSLDGQTGAIDLSASAAGTYTVRNTIDATDSCPAVLDSTTVTVMPAVTASLAHDGPLSFCAGSVVTLTASGGDTYQFLLNGQPINGTTATTLIATQSGAYSVVASATGGCQDTSATMAVLVSPAQSAAFSYGASGYCLSGQNPTPTITGTTGGTFTATPTGLSLDAASGEITLSASSAGVYDVTYITPGPCADTATTTLTLTEPLSAAFSYPAALDTVCGNATAFLMPVFGLNSGAGTFSASSPNVFFSTPAGDISVSDTPEGTYTIYNSVAASGGCPAVLDSVTITIEHLDDYVLKTDASLDICQGESVTVDVVVNPDSEGQRLPSPQALGPLSYQFYLNGQPIAGATSSSYSTGQAGNYFAIISTPAGCTDTTDVVTITVNPLQSAAFSYGQSTFCLGGTGAVLPTITGSTGGTFSVAPSGLTVDAQSGAIDLTTATAGTYAVIYTTAGPCANADTVQVTLTTAPSAAFVYASGGPAPRCVGSTDVLTPTISQGAQSGTFSATPAGLTLDPQTGAITLATSQAGVYTVRNTLAASGSCAASADSVTVTVQEAPTAGLTAAGGLSICAGDSTLLIASGAGLNGIYQFLLDGQLIDDATNDSLMATQAGDYSVIVTNGAGCEATSAALTVTVTPAQSATLAYGQTTYCLSGVNPTPTVTGASGGTFSAPPGLTIDAATGTLDLAASTAGTYTVTYTTAGPCAAAATATVTLTTAPSAAFTYSATGSACAGTAGTLTPTLATGAVNGIFSVRGSGLTLDPATGAITLATSAAGTYTVLNSVAASGTCLGTTDSATVTINAAPTAALVAGGATTFCVGDSVVLAATGGTSYQFLLNGQPLSGATNDSLTATQAGDYAVVVTNSAGCAATSAALTVTINPAQSAAFAYNAATYCLGGVNPTPTVTGTTGGSFTASTGLTVDPATGTIDLTASVAGTYTVTYTTAGPCAASATATVTLTTAPSAAFSYPATAPACAGTTGALSPTLATGALSGTFSAGPGLTIDPATGTIDLSTSVAGTYTVRNAVGASGACPATLDSTTVTLNGAPAAALAAGGATIFCIGDSVLLTASGGASYQFLLNGQPISGATNDSLMVTLAGDYSVVATSAAGCQATSAALTITVNPAQSAAFAYDAATYCLGGTAQAPTVTGAPGGTFSSTAGLTLDSSTGAIDLAASAAGTYVVTYTTAGPCAASATATVTLQAAPSAAFSYPATGSACAGATGTLTPTLATGAVSGTFSAGAGLTIDAQTGTINLATSAAGTYMVTNTLAASGTCPGTQDSAAVTINALPTTSLTAAGPLAVCTGDSVVLTATGGASYQFLLNGQPISGATNPTFSATQTGTYSVIATSVAGCQAVSAALTVTVNPTESAAFAYDSASYCLSAPPPTPTITGNPGGSFTAPTGLTIDPATGVIDLAASAAGTYVVTYTTAGPCPASATATVTLTTAPSAAFSYLTTGPVCAGSTATLTPALATGAVSGTFSAQLAGLTIDPQTGVINLATSAPGTYTIRNTIAGSCSAVDSTTLTISARPSAILVAGGATSFCQGDSVRLSTTGGVSHQFLLNGQPITGATGTSLMVTQAGSYQVVVTNAAGCQATSTPVVVTVSPQAVATFAYSLPTYCLSGTNPVPTITGTAGGTFSSTAGLTIDPATGAIDLVTSAAGTYTVTYDTGTPCPATGTATVMLTAPGIATFSYPTAGGCAGTPGTLTPILAGSAGTFTAAPATGLTLAPATGVIDLSTSTPGTYIVTNTLPPAGGCGAVAVQQTVTILALPTVVIQNLSTALCQNDPTVPLTGTINGQPASVTFTVNGTPATSFDPALLGPGTYTVVASGSVGACAGSATATVTVNPAPAQPGVVPVSQPSGIVLLLVPITPGQTVQWFLNGTPLPGASNDTLAVTTAAQSGTYTAVVTGANGCASVPSAGVPVTVTATPGVLTAALLQLYPNPTTDGQVVVELPALAAATPLTVYDAAGRRVFATTLVGGTTRAALDLHTLPSGVYLVKVGAAVRRLVRD